MFDSDAIVAAAAIYDRLAAGYSPVECSCTPTPRCARPGPDTGTCSGCSCPAGCRRGRSPRRGPRVRAKPPAGHPRPAVPRRKAAQRGRGGSRPQGLRRPAAAVAALHPGFAWGQMAGRGGRVRDRRGRQELARLPGPRPTRRVVRDGRSRRPARRAGVAAVSRNDPRHERRAAPGAPGRDRTAEVPAARLPQNPRWGRAQAVAARPRRLRAEPPAQRRDAADHPDGPGRDGSPRLGGRGVGRGPPPGHQPLRADHDSGSEVLPGTARGDFARPRPTRSGAGWRITG